MTIVGDGQHAVNRFGEEASDLILMDVQMPVLVGIQATRRIREIETQRGSDRTPVIAATAHAFQEDREDCILAGMDDFLSKPYSGTDIVPLLRRWLGPGQPWPQDTVSSDVANNRIPQEESDDAGETIDQSVIRQLRDLDASGEDRVLKKVCDVFLRTTPDQLSALEDRAVAGDLPGIALIAHWLKTAAANVAAQLLSALFRKLEHTARNDDATSCSPVIDCLRPEYDRVCKEFERITGERYADRRSA